MKTFTTFFGSLVAGAALVAQISSARTDIKVKVAGIKNDTGQIILMLFDSEPGFPSDMERAYKLVKLPAAKGGLSYTFKEIPFGTYAVTVGHDENGNDELDKNFLGLPKERVGVSHQTSFGKPNFQRSKFELSDKKTLDLTVTFLN